MSMLGEFLISALVAFILILAINGKLSPKRLKVLFLFFRFVLKLRKIKRVAKNLNSLEYRLKKAKEAVEALRSGFYMAGSDEKHKVPMSPYNIDGKLDDIDQGIELGFSYKDMHTTAEEVFGFRSGEAHKTSAKLQLEKFRRFELSNSYNIMELVESGGLTLESIGTKEEELDMINRESLRRSCQWFVDHFREWATGVSIHGQDVDEFKRRLVQDMMPRSEGGFGFSYEELRTNQEECEELIHLALRRGVVSCIETFKKLAKEGRSDFPNARWPIGKALEKAGLVLSDFGMTEFDLDKIQRDGYILRARKSLENLKNPGKGWFYSDPHEYPNGSFLISYWPALWQCIPGDPLYFVMEIRKDLENAKAVLADIETDEFQIKELVCAGHLVSAAFLLEDLERISNIPRRTKFQIAMGLIGPRAMFIDDPSNPVDRKELENPYPVERDIQAIEYHLKGAGIQLEDIGSSEEKLQKLKFAVEAR